MARTSGETLSTSFGKPCSLARYISPSNSSRTGQKSFSNASRLENIAVLPVWEDALQFSNEGLTLPVVIRGYCQRVANRNRASDRMRLHPVGDRAPDGGTGILLDEVRTRHRHLGLVLPGAAELAHRPDQDCARVGVDEQLWDAVLRHPPGIVGNDPPDVGRLARDRDLPRPGQRRPAILTLEERLAVFRHLGLGQLAQHRPRQHSLYKYIAIEDHLLALLGAKTLEDR